MSKYEALTRHLNGRRESNLSMNFAQIESILGFKLPASARDHRPWWANTKSGHSQSNGWMEAGYQTEQVDLAAERLVFARLNEVDPAQPPQPAPRKGGTHPLIGCMAGTITIRADVDLTAPLFTDEEMEAWADRKAALLRGGVQ